MLASALAETPEPPYYAVIFSSLRTDGDRGYEAMAKKMADLAGQQPGFLGIETARDANGVGITVSYWGSEEAIVNWKANADHQVAQQAGQKTWYRDYQLRVARVERAYGRPADRDESALHPSKSG
jgi:heme-degrading monooxygenase HmoA